MIDPEDMNTLIIGQEDMNILIINMHDSEMKYILKREGYLPYPLGYVDEYQMPVYKNRIYSLLETLVYLGYKVMK